MFTCTLAGVRVSIKESSQCGENNGAEVPTLLDNGTDFLLQHHLLSLHGQQHPIKLDSKHCSYNHVYIKIQIQLSTFIKSFRAEGGVLC